MAAYLTWVHYDAGALVCGLGDCHAVQASAFATIGPVPIALLGLGMYVVILACNLVAWRQRVRASAAATIACAVVLAGTMYAAYLTWLEVAVIGAVCRWCVVSAVLTLFLAIAEAVMVWQGFSTPLPGAETSGAGAASLNASARRRGTTGAGQ